MDELAIYSNVIQGPDRLDQTPNSSLVGGVMLCLTDHIWVRLSQGVLVCLTEKNREQTIAQSLKFRVERKTLSMATSLFREEIKTHTLGA
jgi:hypothetical protein